MYKLDQGKESRAEMEKVCGNLLGVGGGEDKEEEEGLVN